MRDGSQYKLSRRAWLASAIVSGLPRGLLAGDLDPIRARGKKARLPEFTTARTEHFQGIGDAPPAYQAEALAATEAIAAEFLAHFAEKGFKVAMPETPMTVVVLASPASYAAFTGEDVQDAVGGHFDIDADRLVVFDFRKRSQPLPAQAEVINSRTLAHETTHQLSYDTGLLDRKSDIPLCINEGIGTYGEVWRPRGRGKIGGVNSGWLEVLRARGAAARWIPLDRLLVEDDLFREAETENQAYAQSWLLVHYALKNKAALPKFRAYLDAIRPRRDAKSRLADFRQHLGEIGRVEADLRSHARRPIGS